MSKYNWTTARVNLTSVVVVVVVGSLFIAALIVCGGFCVFSLLCYALFGVLSSFATILMGKIERAGCFTFGLLTVSVLCLFLMVPWVGLQCVIVVFPDHAQLLFRCM